MADIDALERLLCQRYNVQALDAGELSTALALARGGELEPLRTALDSREFYRWTDAIYEALDAPAEAEPEAEPEGEPEAHELEALTIAELRALAEERGVDLGDARRKADIVAALELAAEADETGPAEPTA